MAKTSDAAAPRRAYEARQQRFAMQHRTLAQRSRRISHARLAVFALLGGSAVWGSEGGGPLAWLLASVAALGFAVLVAQHARTRRAEQRAAALRGFAAAGLARLDRAWERLPVWDGPPYPADHPYADDLDLFGRGSLTQLLGQPGSPRGRVRVAAWLLALPGPEETYARQASVRELAARIDYRDELALRARAMHGIRGEDVDAFLAWCEESGDSRGGWSYAVSVLVPITLWTAVLLRLTGLWSADVWLVPAAVSVALTFGAPGARTRRAFARVFRREALFHAAPDLLGYIAETEYATTRLQRVRDALQGSGDSPRVELERLRGIAHLSDLRRSILYVPIQLLTLWDQHVLRRLHGWRNRNGRHVRGWLDAAADAEALSAFATLAHDNPEWCYAEIRNEPRCVEGLSLGHPLLAPGVRVTNDVTVGPPGTFLLVTGSNMSGKSTLLRAIGINIVLARAGAPACAAGLRLPVALPCVSMRVQDSLSRGVSFFMAELQRTRIIVTLAEAAVREGWTCVFLLDEMLHGTNSAERRIAARMIVERLMRAGAIGAVSTHDLQLGAEPALHDLAVRVHFTETITRSDGRAVMTFDYKLRPGDATSTNALMLVELMGLGTAAGAPGD